MVSKPFFFPRTSRHVFIFLLKHGGGCQQRYTPTVRQNRENYLLCQAQHEPILRGHHLLGYADGSKPMPPTTIKISETTDGKDVEKMVLNPEYEECLTVDPPASSMSS
jgi:hypothetical protein